MFTSRNTLLRHYSTGGNLRNGFYLNHEIEAVVDDWLIVFDGKYNHMLFNTQHNGVRRSYEYKRLPSNGYDTGIKLIEYYSSFDNALYGLAKI